MPPITMAIIRLRPHRGKRSSDASNNFDKSRPHRAAAAECRERLPCNNFGIGRRAHAHIGACLKAAAHRPRRGRDDIDAAGSELQPQRFGECLDERFRSSIGSRARYALKRKQRAHQHQPAAPVRSKPAGEVVGQFDDRAAIDVDHLEFAAKQALDKIARRAEAGDGREQTDFEIACFVRDDRGCGAIREIKRQHPDLDAMPQLQFGGERVKQFFPARDEHEIHSRCRQFDGHRAADAVRSAGYDCPWTVFRSQSRLARRCSTVVTEVMLHRIGRHCQPSEQSRCPSPSSRLPRSTSRLVHRALCSRGC